MSNFTPNPKGVMEKNNRTALEIDKHNRSWNGKEYTYKKKSVAKKMKPHQRMKIHPIHYGEKKEE